MQPYEMTEDFFISRHDHKYQNYFSHIKQNKRPDPEIMKTSKEIHNDSLSHKADDDRNHNFGLAHMFGFPLQAFIKGLCKLSINILKQQSPTHSDEYEQFSSIAIWVVMRLLAFLPAIDRSHAEQTFVLLASGFWLLASANTDTKLNIL